MKILILGVSGMLGHNLFTNLNKYEYDLYGTIRDQKFKDTFFKKYKDSIYNIDFKSKDLTRLKDVIDDILPNYVINCIGIIKQKYDDNLGMYKYINSELPFILDNMSIEYGYKLIHFSTDCVFKGNKGNYNEESISDAEDLYGKSKFDGEIHEGKSLTLRTSIIGHELNSAYSLLEWFLNENSNEINGYANAIFSGLPTVYVSDVLHKYIFGRDISGLYHLSVNPINKYNLLKKIAKTYNKKIIINKDTDLKIDRSLCCKKLIKKTGYNYPDWDELISMMYQDHLKNKIYENKQA